MSCKICSDLLASVEYGARELVRAKHEAQVAIDGISGIVAGNRIEDAEYRLRLSTQALRDHQDHCTGE